MHAAITTDPVRDVARKAAVEFFEHVYPDPRDRKILIWAKGDAKVSHWCATPAAAAACAERLAATHDVYFGCGLSDTDRGPNARCPASEIAGVAGLWLDIDIAGPGHEKPNLPPDEASAMKLIAEMPLPPTIIVRTGGGLQAWWLFNETWIFTDAGERARAAALVRGRNDLAQRLAEKHGWVVDSTHDLSRVMRLPGTFNHKTGTPRAVTMLSADGPRYEPDDFDDYAAEGEAATPVEAAIADVGEFTIRADAQPPMAKLAVLFHDEPLSLLTFNHRNPSLRDQSQSSYDFSMGNYLVRAGFTDQEIVDTLIYMRRAAGEPDKLREDYYRRTLGKLRGGIEQTAVRSEAEQYLSVHDPAAERERIDRDPNAMAEIRKQLSVAIGCEIVRVVKFLKDPPEYMLQTEHGEVDLGGVEGLIEQWKFRRALAAAQGHLMPPFKRERWDGIARWLLAICEAQDVGPTGTDRGVIAGLVSSYLDQNDIGNMSVERVRAHQPFRRGGAVCIFGEEFRLFLHRRQERISPKEMGRLFRKLGARPVIVEVDHGGNRLAKRVWEFPRGCLVENGVEYDGGDDDEESR